jgi:hypothetical protein
VSLTTHPLTVCVRLTTGTHYDDRAGWRFKCPCCGRVARITPTLGASRTILCDGVRLTQQTRDQ